jgi:hypothetical protein
MVTAPDQESDREARLGGMGAMVAEELAKRTGKEARHCVLGHLQRGGSPTPFDRALCSMFGAMAVELVAASPDEAICQSLLFSCGIEPVHVPNEPDDWSAFARKWLRDQEIPGRIAMLVAGPSALHSDANHRIEFLRSSVVCS